MTGERRRRPPRLIDVAERAGVSPKTVSRALNNEPNVRPEKVARIRQAAAELGFKPNQFARLLRTRGATAMIGVLTADVGDPFWTGVLRGVEAGLGDADYFILSASTRDRDRREAEIVAAMVDRRVAALIVVPTAEEQSHLQAVIDSGTPVVCVDRQPTGVDVDCVICDDRGGAEQATALLLAAGHERIAFFGTPAIYTTDRRLAGFRRAHERAGVAVDDDLVWSRLGTPDERVAAVAAAMATGDRPTAAFSSNVSTSLALLAAVADGSWRPAFAAFSEFDAAAVTTPAVTVVDNDPVALGRRAAELALDRLGGYTGPARTEQIDTPLIVRESHLVEESGVPA